MKKYSSLLFLAILTIVSAAGCKTNDDPDNTVVTPPEEKPHKVNRTPWRETGLTDSRYAYIANDDVQIGVDLERGGGIFHFSTRKYKVNRLNHADEGRFIQQSYYGNDGITYWWASNQWTWNPIQGGGSDGQSAVVKKSKLTDSTIMVVTTPRQWGRTTLDGPCELAEDCEMTEMITLVGKYAVLDFTFKYSGDKDLGTRSQEVPALFCDWDLGRFARYTGTEPWTGDKLTVTVPGVLSGISNPNKASIQSEEWCAYVNSKDYGIGLYTPGTNTAVYYTAGAGPGGATSGSCSYFAPIRSLHIEPGFVLNYKAYLTIGTLDEMRETFKEIHDSISLEE
ncbi:MAG: hypothetical protein ACI399_00760 [Candidatus Cryptobacteroides sp.]